MNTLEQFLEAHGDEFMQLHDGLIRIETSYAKKFRAMGGDINRLLICLEECGNMRDAARRYIDGLPVECPGCGKLKPKADFADDPAAPGLCLVCNAIMLHASDIVDRAVALSVKNKSPAKNK